MNGEAEMADLPDSDGRWSFSLAITDNNGNGISRAAALFEAPTP